jgi:hypothetical protein
MRKFNSITLRPSLTTSPRDSYPRSSYSGNVSLQNRNSPQSRSSVMNSRGFRALEVNISSLATMDKNRPLVAIAALPLAGEILTRLSRYAAMKTMGCLIRVNGCFKQPQWPGSSDSIVLPGSSCVRIRSVRRPLTLPPWKQLATAGGKSFRCVCNRTTQVETARQKRFVAFTAGKPFLTD